MQIHRVMVQQGGGKLEKEGELVMPASRDPALTGWLGIPEAIERATEGLSSKQLDVRGGQEGLSAREVVHHLVEANLVASNIILAALAKSGCTFDWSWVTPNGAWMKRLGYDRLEIRPGLELLRSLVEHIALLIEASGDGLDREVQLLDSPGAALHTRTVRGVLEEEVKHAVEHLQSAFRVRNAQPGPA